MNLQIWRRYDNGTWCLAWGLQPRSFPKAHSEKEAIMRFFQSTKRCKNHLVLFRYPDMGNVPSALAQVNVPREMVDMLDDVSCEENVLLFNREFDNHTQATLVLLLNSYHQPRSDPMRYHDAGQCE